MLLLACLLIVVTAMLANVIYHDSGNVQKTPRERVELAAFATGLVLLGGGFLWTMVRACMGLGMLLVGG